jgi:hypothetical protein
MTYLPLAFREKDSETECACCKHKKVIPKTISLQEYIKLDTYLDDFKKGLEKYFFESKFVYCDKCNNFGIENLQSLIYNELDKPNIQKVLHSQKDKTEQLFIISHIILNNLNSLTELYWYYDFNKPLSTELKSTRNELIKRYKKKIKNKEDQMYSRLMLVELYRRNGDFKKAIKYIHMWPNETTVRDMEILNKQLTFCMNKDISRH